MQTKCWSQVSTKNLQIVFGQPNHTDQTVLYVELISGTQQKEDNYVTVNYPFETLNVKTHGLRKGELVTMTAGSGVGKSSFCRHVALHLLQKILKLDTSPLKKVSNEPHSALWE